MLRDYRNYITQNQNVKYSVCFEKLPFTAVDYKWVGAQYFNHCLYGIPNGMDAILKHTAETNIFLDKMGRDAFKWTGGCMWNNCLYGFSRTQNCIFKMSLETEKVEYIFLENRYLQEHHYGGVCTKEGIVYQPPRDCNHILVWNLKTGKTRKIYLNLRTEQQKFRFCGSVIHPDGYIFFLPEMGERVIRLNIKTEEWSFIGGKINAMVFDARVAIDNNIYGYSAYCDGILKIDIKTGHTEMIHKEINPGAYGTKLGVNGHLYSIPGNGNYVWDFDPISDSLRNIFEVSDYCEAKYAGGVTTPQGDILAVPAKENRLMKLKVDTANITIPKDIYFNYFTDCY